MRSLTLRLLLSNLSDGDTTYYAIVDGTNNAFEVGLGTFTASGTTLARTTIIASSNSNNAVDLAAGTKEVFITVPADKMIVKDASGNVSLGSGSFTANGGINVDNITIDGTEIDFSGNGIIDTGGDLLIDIGTPGGSGQKITFGLGASDKGHIDLTNSDFTIKSLISDKDIIFKGNDGGS